MASTIKTFSPTPKWAMLRASEGFDQLRLTTEVLDATHTRLTFRLPTNLADRARMLASILAQEGGRVADVPWSTRNGVISIDHTILDLRNGFNSFAITVTHPAELAEGWEVTLGTNSATVGTTTQQYGLATAPTRGIVYEETEGYWVLLIYDGQTLEAWTSSNGTNYTQRNNANDDGSYNCNQNLFHLTSRDSSGLIDVSYHGGSGSSDRPHFRQITVNSDGTLTGGTDTEVTTEDIRGISHVVNDSGLPRITFYEPGSNDIETYFSSNAAGTSWSGPTIWSDGGPSSDQRTDYGDNTYGHVVLPIAADTDDFTVLAHGQAYIQSCPYDDSGSAFGTVVTPVASGADNNISGTTHWSLAALDNGEWHLVYLTSTHTLSHVKYASGSWSSVASDFTTLSAGDCIKLASNGNALVCVYTKSDDTVNYKEWTSGGGWGSETEIYDGTTALSGGKIDVCNTVNSNGDLGLAWITGTGSPFTVTAEVLSLGAGPSTYALTAAPTGNTLSSDAVTQFNRTDSASPVVTSLTSDIEALLLRALNATPEAHILTSDIVTMFQRSLEARVRGDISTSDAVMLLSRALSSLLQGSTLTADAVNRMLRALQASLEADTFTSDATASLIKIIALSAALRGDTLTSDAAMRFLRALSAAPQGHTLTSDATALLARSLSAQLAGNISTSDATAILLRVVSAAIEAHTLTSDAISSLIATVALSAALRGDTQTSDLTALMLRELQADPQANTLTSNAISSLIATVALSAALHGDTQTSDLTALMLRELQADPQANTLTSDAVASIVGLILLRASLQANIGTSDAAATLNRALSAHPMMDTRTADAASIMLRTLAATIETHTLTADAVALMLRAAGAALRGDTLTSDATAILLRTLRGAVQGDTLTADAVSVMKRSLATGLDIHVLTSDAEVSVVTIYALTASLVGATLTSDLAMLMQRALSASPQGNVASSDAIAVLLRALSAALEAHTLTADASIILVILGIILDPSLQSLTRTKAITTLTQARTITSLTRQKAVIAL